MTIKGKNRQEIIEAATSVFVRNGFRVAKPVGCDASFERQGSSWDKFAYSGLTGKAVWFRAKLFVRVRGAEERLLECELYRVEDMGDALMEEERPMTKLKGGPYRKLLEETRTLLEAPAP